MKFHALIQITRMMADEFREMHPHQFTSDPDVKIAFRNGLEGFKSDSVDLILSHNDDFPITIVLFYDSQIYLEKIMANLAEKILDVFVFKFEKQFKEGLWINFTSTNPNYQQIGLQEAFMQFDFSENPGVTFESALPLIFEDVSKLTVVKNT